MGQNLLVDPSFENKDTTVWKMAISGGRTFFDSAAEQGLVCEQMTLPGVAFPRAVWQTVRVDTGTSYDVSGWIKTKAIINSSAHILILWFNSATPPNSEIPGGYVRIDTVGNLAGTNPWTNLKGTFTSPTGNLTGGSDILSAQIYLECTAAANNSGTAWFDNMSFSVHKVMCTLISAVAGCSSTPQAGTDSAYVLLTFDKAVDIFDVTPQNINTIFPLSPNHTWLSGFGSIGSAIWNPDSTKLLITLSTTVSPPTIAVGDTIGYSLGLGQVVLTGSFAPSVAVQPITALETKSFSMVKTPGFVRFTCPEQAHLQIVDVAGHIIADLGWGTTFKWEYASNKRNATAAIYFVRLLSSNHQTAVSKLCFP
jgi:hypothetical protein